MEALLNDSTPDCSVDLWGYTAVWVLEQVERIEVEDRFLLDQGNSLTVFLLFTFTHKQTNHRVMCDIQNTATWVQKVLTWLATFDMLTVPQGDIRHLICFMQTSSRFTLLQLWHHLADQIITWLFFSFPTNPVYWGRLQPPTHSWTGLQGPASL